MNDNGVKLWGVPRDLTGNVFVFGKPGSGKTCKLLNFCQGFHSKGFKIWDIYGGEQFEGPFWCFPNTDTSMWRDVERETYDLSKPGPKEYKVNLLYPMFSNSLPKRLPELLPRIKSKVFTIPFKDITFDMISTVSGPLSNVCKDFWNEIMANTVDSSGIEELKKLIDVKFWNRKSTSLYKIFLKPLINNNLFSSRKGKMVLDFVDEAENIETISVLCLDYVPKEFHWFVMSYLLLQLKRAAMSDKIHRKNIALFREAGDFMKVEDENESKRGSNQEFRNIINTCARMCRRGLFLAMDTQSSSQTKGIIAGADDLMGICELPDPASIEATCLPFKRVGRMSKEQMSYISFGIKIHEICIIEKGKKAFILKRINPPRCAYWTKSTGNFETYWKRMYDSWVKTQVFIDVLDADSDRDSSRVKALLLFDVPDVATWKKASKNASVEPVGTPNEGVVGSAGELAEKIAEISPKTDDILSEPDVLQETAPETVSATKRINENGGDLKEKEERQKHTPRRRDKIFDRGKNP